MPGCPDTGVSRTNLLFMCAEKERNDEVVRNLADFAEKMSPGIHLREE